MQFFIGGWGISNIHTSHFVEFLDKLIAKFTVDKISPSLDFNLVNLLVVVFVVFVVFVIFAGGVNEVVLLDGLAE